MKIKKNPTIAIPADVVLNENGLNQCYKQSIPFRDIVNNRGNRKEGFTWQNFKADVLQKMLLNDLVESVEIKRSEYTSVRPDLIDLTKLMTYGLIYRKFITDIRTVIVSSPQFEALKKKNPGIVTDGFFFTKKQAEQFLASGKVNLPLLRSELLMAPYSDIDCAPGMDDITAEISKYTLEKLLNIIDTGTWFLLYLILRGGGRLQLIDNLNTVMISALRRTEIAEYIALVLCELLMNPEMANYEAIARSKNLLRNGDSIALSLREKVFKNIIGGYIKSIDKNIKISYSVKNFTDEDKRLRFRISVVYDGTMSESLKALIKKETEDITKLLSYSEGGTGYGLYYLSFIKDACREQQIGFESRIVDDMNKGETEYLIMLNI